MAEASADLFQLPHGTTFGGNPLAAAAANAVLDIIEDEQLLDQVQANSIAWHQALQALADTYPQHIAGMRGAGYMVGLPCTPTACKSLPPPASTACPSSPPATTPSACCPHLPPAPNNWLKASASSTPSSQT